MHYERAQQVYSKCKFPLSQEYTRLQFLLECPKFVARKEGQHAIRKCKEIQNQIMCQKIDKVKPQNEQFNINFQHYISKHRQSQQGRQVQQTREKITLNVVKKNVSQEALDFLRSLAQQYRKIEVDITLSETGSVSANTDSMVEEITIDTEQKTPYEVQVKTSDLADQNKKSQEQKADTIDNLNIIITDEELAYDNHPRRRPKLVKTRTRELFKPENAKKNNKVAPVQSLVSDYKFAYTRKSSNSSEYRVDVKSQQKQSIKQIAANLSNLSQILDKEGTLSSQSSNTSMFSDRKNSSNKISIYSGFSNEVKSTTSQARALITPQQFLKKQNVITLPQMAKLNSAKNFSHSKNGTNTNNTNLNEKNLRAVCKNLKGLIQDLKISPQEDLLFGISPMHRSSTQADDFSVKSKFCVHTEPSFKKCSEDDLLQFIHDINTPKDLEPFTLIKNQTFNTFNNVNIQNYQQNVVLDEEEANLNVLLNKSIEQQDKENQQYILQQIKSLHKHQNIAHETIEEDYVLENMGSGCSEEIRMNSTKNFQACQSGKGPNCVSQFKNAANLSDDSF